MDLFWPNDSNSRTRDICYFSSLPVHLIPHSQTKSMNPEKSAFMALPAEIRLRILYYMLQPSMKFIASDSHHIVARRPIVDMGRSRLCTDLIKDENYEINRRACWGTSATTQILLVNRRLREEAEEVCLICTWIQERS